jgi:hypothetical protein
MLVLRLPEANAILSDVLWPQPHGIFPAATCIDE